MKSVFVYYSLTGNGDYLATLFKSEGLDVLKLETKHTLPKNRFFRMMTGGAEALFQCKAKLNVARFDLSAYDRIVLGTPVWNGRLTPAILSFLKNNSLSGKEVILVSYGGSGEAPKSGNRIAKSLLIKTIVALKEPLLDQEGAISALKKANLLK